MTVITRHEFFTIVCFVFLLRCICPTSAKPAPTDGEGEEEDTTLFNHPFFKNYTITDINDLLEQPTGTDIDNDLVWTKTPRPAPRYPDLDDGIMYMPVPNFPEDPDSQPCRRVSRVINLQKDLKWNFVSPNIVDIGMCTGYCPSLTASINMHTRIRGLLQDEHSPCCVPVEFKTSVFRVKVYLPHFDWYYTYIERRNDTVVKSCECR